MYSYNYLIMQSLMKIYVHEGKTTANDHLGFQMPDVLSTMGCNRGTWLSLISSSHPSGWRWSHLITKHPGGLALEAVWAWGGESTFSGRRWWERCRTDADGAPGRGLGLGTAGRGWGSQ